jgi:hypothetical protein
MTISTIPNDVRNLTFWSIIPVHVSKHGVLDNDLRLVLAHPHVAVSVIPRSFFEISLVSVVRWFSALFSSPPAPHLLGQAAWMWSLDSTPDLVPRDSGRLAGQLG